MEPWLRYLIGGLILALLVIVFVVSFLLYKKTPPPKGCEDVMPNEGKCHGCKEVGCHFNLYYNSKDPQDEDQSKEEKEK